MSFQLLRLKAFFQSRGFFMPKRAAAPTPPPATPKARKSTTHATAKKVTSTRSAPAFAAAVVNPAEYHAAIAKLAYRNWQARGDGPGSPEDDWFRAETEFRAGQRA
jgi:hypothetical protein